MKKISTVGLALLLIMGLASCGNSQDNKSNSESQGSKTIAKNVNTTQFQELIKSKKEIIILDVRTPQEVASGAIEDNVALDFYAPDFQNQLSKLDKDTPILIYCAVGGRSGNAMQAMKKMGFKEVYNLSGGIRAWISEGRPVK